MRHLANLPHDRSAHRATRTAILTAVLGAGLALSPMVVAQQGTPEASPAASPAASPVASPVAQAVIESTPLMGATFNELAPAPMTIRMLRITLAPGATVPMHTHPGPEFDRIETGTLTVQANGNATIKRSDGSEEAATAEGTDLTAGDWILYPAGSGMALENRSDEDVVILSAVLLPVGADFPESITYTDGAPTEEEFDGVTFTVLGDGLVQQFPAGPASVNIDSVIVPPGTDLPPADSVAMYSQVSGNFSFVVDSGAVQVSRSELESLQPNAIPGEEFTLEPGDAAFFPQGVTATSRTGESQSLELLRLTLESDQALAEQPAQLTFTEGGGTQGDATGGAQAPQTTPVPAGPVGAIVTTNSEDINIRAEASTSSDVVDQLASGVELEVIGGPVDADGYTWYQVRVTAEGGSQGWIAAEFLDGDLGAASTPTPAAPAAGTPTPAATNASLASGVQVQTTEDNVRLRTEPSVNADIVDSYAVGTVFVVTGPAQEGDEFVWFPVALAGDESVTGWIAVDFLQTAPTE